MTTNDAKKIVADKLNAMGLPEHKLTAKTVDFSDLARGEKVFVKVHGWKPCAKWDELKEAAKASGFMVE